MTFNTKICIQNKMIILKCMSMFKISTRMQVVSKVYSPYRLFVSGKEEPLNHKNKQTNNVLS